MNRMIPFAALALLAGCNSEPSVTATNTSVTEVQNQVAAAGADVKMKPGRWEGTMSMKGAAPNGAASSNSQPILACITADQLKPGANPFAALQAGCTYDRFKMEGGDLDAVMTCKQHGMTIKTNVTGEFTAESYRANSSTEMSGGPAGAMAGMKTDSAIDIKRTGECKGDEKKG